MVLPTPDSDFLASRGVPHEVRPEGGMVCVVFPGWSLPPGYDRANADLLVRLPSGYPDLPPDMWWFDPAVRLASGSSAPATEAVEAYLGRRWQRWSRHFKPGQW